MPPGDNNPTRQYTNEERERALTALALRGGSVTRARELMAQDPLFDRVPEAASLKRWQRDYAERYSEILVLVAPQLEEAAKHDYRQIVARTNEAHLAAIERAHDGIKVDIDLPADATPEDIQRASELASARWSGARDASQVAKNLAIAGGVAADKLALAEGRPTSITEHRDPDQILRAIEAIAGRRDSVDSSAVEEPRVSELASPVD